MFPVIPIVPIFNRVGYFKRCIKSLFEQEELDAICIVDNASDSDEMKTFLREIGIDSSSRSDCFMYVNKYRLCGKDIIYIRLSRNIGTAAWSKAISYLITETDYDYFYLMDDDSFVGKGSFKSMKPYLYNEDCITSVKLSDRNGTLLFFMGFCDRSYYFPVRTIDPNISIIPDYITFASNIGVAISREVVLKIGYHREDFFVRAEDVEFSFRLYTHGFKIKTVSTSRIYHPVIKVDDLSKTLFSARNMLEVWRIYGDSEYHNRKLDELYVFGAASIVDFYGTYRHVVSDLVRKLQKSIMKVNRESTNFLKTFLGVPINTPDLSSVKLPNERKFICLCTTSFLKRTRIYKHRDFAGSIFYERPSEWHVVPFSRVCKSEKICYDIFVEPNWSSLIKLYFLLHDRKGNLRIIFSPRIFAEVCNGRVDMYLLS